MPMSFGLFKPTGLRTCPAYLVEWLEATSATSLSSVIEDCLERPLLAILHLKLRAEHAVRGLSHAAHEMAYPLCNDNIQQGHAKAASIERRNFAGKGHRPHQKKIVSASSS